MPYRLYINTNYVCCTYKDSSKPTICGYCFSRSKANCSARVIVKEESTVENSLSVADNRGKVAALESEVADLIGINVELVEKINGLMRNSLYIKKVYKTKIDRLYSKIKGIKDNFKAKIRGLKEKHLLLLEIYKLFKDRLAALEQK